MLAFERLKKQRQASYQVTSFLLAVLSLRVLVVSLYQSNHKSMQYQAVINHCKGIAMDRIISSQGYQYGIEGDLARLKGQLSSGDVNVKEE